MPLIDDKTDDATEGKYKDRVGLVESCGNEGCGKECDADGEGEHILLR